MIVDEKVILERDVSDFLEHFGVRGMKWGVRRAQRHKQSGPEKSVNRQLRKLAPKTAEQRAQRKKHFKVAAVVGGAAAVAGAAYVTRKLLKPKVKVKMVHLPSSIDLLNTQEMADHLRALGVFG